MSSKGPSSNDEYAKLVSEKTQKKVLFSQPISDGRQIERNLAMEDRRSVKMTSVLTQDEADVLEKKVYDDVECGNSQESSGPSLVLLQFETQLRYLKAQKLARRIGAIDKRRKKDGTIVARRLSVESFEVLKNELQSAERLQRFYARKAQYTMTHFDIRDKENEINRLKGLYQDKRYIQKRDAKVLIEIIELNNILRRTELMSSQAWFDSLDDNNEEEYEDVLPKEEEKLGCFDTILIAIGLKEAPLK